MESVLLFVLGVLIIVIGLAVSIGLHEIGHLVPAKLFGVKVTQYMIGFGRTLWSRRRGETEYGVKAIPLGGYISMIGMFPPKNGAEVRESSTGFFNALVQEGDTQDPRTISRLDDVVDGDGRSAAGRADRSNAYAAMVDDARQASAESIGEGEDARAFYRLPVWKRIIIMAGGPFMNLVIAVVLFTVLLCGFGTAQLTTTLSSVSECVLPQTSTSQTCDAGATAAPGAAAGLEPGDTIVSIDGTAVSTWAESTAIIRGASGETLSFVIERDGEQLTVPVTPVANETYVTDSTGAIVKDANGVDETQTVGFVGISPTQALVPQPITAVLPTVGENIANVAGVIINLPQRLVDVAQAAFGSEERDANGPISVVGVGRIAGEIAASDQLPIVSKVYSIIGVLASLNIALLVFNLVPLLPMDGGHIAGALWEGIRRRVAKLFGRKDPGPVDIAKLMPVTFVVVIILGGMSALLIYADIVKPINLF